MLTMLRGTVADRLTVRGYNAIDHLDLREWLRRHGASRRAIDSPLVRGHYDLSFAYEDGDPNRPRFPAGLALHLAMRMFLDYKGAMFWKMRAGMGDVVFAPLYEALRRRGVRFRFFHRLDQLHLSDDSRTVEAATFGCEEACRRRVCAAGPDPRASRLPGPLGPAPAGRRQRATGGGPRLRRPRARRLARHAPAHLRRADRGRRALAIDGRPGRHRRHPGVPGLDGRRRADAGLGPARRDGDGMRGAVRDLRLDEPHAPVRGLARGRATADRRVLLRGARRERARGRAGGVGAGAGRPRSSSSSVAAPPCGPRRPTRTATFAPSSCTPGTGARTSIPRIATSSPSRARASYRLPADGSGFENLFLAGDWIDSGLNAGCIEAAVLGGLQAANAVEGRPLADGTSGGYLPRQAVHSG